MVTELGNMSEPIVNRDQIKNVALISSNGDEKLAEDIVTSIEKINALLNNCDVSEPVKANTLNTSAKLVLSVSKRVKIPVLVKGMQFDRGSLSPYFITNAESMTVELDNPLILVHEKKISSVESLKPLLEDVLKTDRDRPCDC